MINGFNNLNPGVFFWIYKLLSALMYKELEEELGREFIEESGKKLVEYAKNSYKEYQKELQKVYNKLPGAYRETLDALLLNIDNSIPCKEETCLNSYNPHKWPSIYLYIYKTHFMTSIIKSINKHLEGLDPTQPNYDKEIKNIRDVLIYLSRPEVYKTLLAAYMLIEYGALTDILSTPENLSIINRIYKQIKYLKASNDIQNYTRAIQDYLQKTTEWLDLAYQRASKYIEDAIEELFQKNEDEFIEKIASAFLKYS